MFRAKDMKGPASHAHCTTHVCIYTCAAGDTVARKPGFAPANGTRTLAIRVAWGIASCDVGKLVD